MPPVHSPLQAAKAALRAQIRAELGRFSADARLAASRELRARLSGQSCWAAARTVMLFAPLADEPDVWPLVDEALRAGKAVALPRFAPDRLEYEAALVADATRDVQPGRFGIREPRPGCPLAPLEQLDLVLVPGVAFDPHGRRLGRGKGYYDRLLARVRGVKCGVGFDLQVVAEVPAGAQDGTLDCLLTPTRWLRF